MFPVLSRMAMDIISVQASSVASESAFSTSGRVLSIRKTRLTLASLEMCMCLKDHLDAKERKQDKCPLETPLDFEGVFDDEVQQNEAIPLSDEEIALDASSEGTMSPGGPRYGVHKQKTDVMVYVTPHRQRGYIKQCFMAAKNEGWLLVDWKATPTCCGYRTFSRQQEENLAGLWDIYLTHSKAVSLSKLGKDAGYISKASFFECALK
ncbi:zinc finger BED domain-containing protein RICESLEEPER 2 [Tanacetum coccineum]